MSALALLAEPDIDWVGEAIDVVEQSAGRPWRDALERLDDLQRAVQPTAPRRFSAVVGALQRVTGGRAKNTRAAREARTLVLGAPALTPDERRVRIARAAEELAVTPAMIETLLWCDLPRERPVELPHGRPSGLEVAAFANVHIIQRALRRARSVTLRVVDDAGPLLRAAATRGLLAHATIDGRGTSVIEIVGPLALFHRTSVYGRALADLVPLLGELRQFSLDIHVQTDTATFTTVLTSPLLLPAPPARLVAAPYPVARLARDLAKALPGAVITTTPDLVAGGGALACPDVAIDLDGTRWYLEIAGFWTADYLSRRLAVYEAAGVRAILCAAASVRQESELPPSVLLFDRRVDVDAVRARIDAAG